MCEPAYLSWCQQHKIAVHGVQPAFVAEGWRGVVATQPLAAGDVVMAVPEQLLLSVLSARRDQQLSAVLQHHQLNSHQILSLHLLHEASKGPASFWSSYIMQLPRRYTTFMAWPQAAVQALQLQHAQAAATAAIDKARSDWAAARPVLRELGVAKKWCSWQAWVWSASSVLSRTMYHPGDPACGCLTPLADLHNYAPPPAPYTPDLAQGMQHLLKTQQQQQRQQHKQQNQQQQQQQQNEPQQQKEQQQEQQHQGQVDDSTNLSNTCQQHNSHAGPTSQQELLQPETVTVTGSCQGGQAAVTAPEVRPLRDGGNVNGQSEYLPQILSTEALGSSGVTMCVASSEQDQHLCIQQQEQQQQEQPHKPLLLLQQPEQLEHDCCHSPATGPCSDHGSNSCINTPEMEGSHAVMAASSSNSSSSSPEGSVQEQQYAAVSTESHQGLGDEAASLSGGGASAAACISGDGHLDAEAGLYKIVVRRSYQPGDQVFLCYGRHTNLELLELYGFMLPDNPHETAALPVELLQQHLQLELQQQRQQQAAAAGQAWVHRLHQRKQQQGLVVAGQSVQLDVAEVDCWVDGNGQPSWQLLSALRVAAASPSEVRAWGYRALNGDPISLDSEVLALKALAAACRAQLAALPTAAAGEDSSKARERLQVEGTTGAQTKGSSSDPGTDAPRHTGPQGIDAVQDTNVKQEGQQQHQQPQQQQEEHETECIMLAVGWLQKYKLALKACIDCCEAALKQQGLYCQAAYLRQGAN